MSISISISFYTIAPWINTLCCLVQYLCKGMRWVIFSSSDVGIVPWAGPIGGHIQYDEAKEIGLMCEVLRDSEQNNFYFAMFFAFNL